MWVITNNRQAHIPVAMRILALLCRVLSVNGVGDGVDAVMLRVVVMVDCCQLLPSSSVLISIILTILKVALNPKIIFLLEE